MLDVGRGAAMESQSGLQMLFPKIYGRFADEGCDRKLAFLVMHPASNFMGHYLIEPLARRRRAILALNSRYVANDTMLLLERAIQDLGAGVRFLRDRGYERVVLIGNSGGGALAALYQAQAEKLTIATTPDGRPIDLRPEHLPPADAVALVCAHPGRAFTLTDWLDPSVLREDDLLGADPDLDMYNPANGPPYDPAWLDRYRARQRRRNEDLTDWCVRRIRALETAPNPRALDEAFVVHRTMADPRFLDLTLDPSDRAPGTVWGPPREVNYAPNNIGRFTTLRSFLSQWSFSHSRGDGPARLAETTVPVLNVDFTADQIVFPSQIRAWSAAAKGRVEDAAIGGVNHYPQTDPGAVERLADILAEWADRHR